MFNMILNLPCTVSFSLIQEMTLEEYEKLLDEKRKSLLALKTEERKVDPKEFASLQQLSSKKENQDIFIKLVHLFSLPLELQLYIDIVLMDEHWLLDILVWSWTWPLNLISPFVGI